MRSRLLLSLLLGALGCQRFERDGNATAAAGAPAASSVSEWLALGQAAVLPSYRVRLVSQRDCQVSRPTATRRAYRSWAVELEVTNSGTEPIPVNPFYATLEDEQRHVYFTSLHGCEPHLPAKLLAPKETVRGYVPFELPTSIQNLQLGYQPRLPGDVRHVARFRIAL